MAQHIYGQPSKGTRVARYPSRRTCSEAGCSTTLSIYNPSEFCSLHESLVRRPRLSPKRA